MRTLKSAISIIPRTMSPEAPPEFFLYHSHCKCSASSASFLNYFQVFFLADDIDILIGFFLNNKALHSHREAIVQDTPIEEASILKEAETGLDHIPSWNCKETKMSSSFGLSSAFFLRRCKTRKFWKGESVQIQGKNQSEQFLATSASDNKDIDTPRVTISAVLLLVR